MNGGGVRNGREMGGEWGGVRKGREMGGEWGRSEEGEGDGR